MTVPYTIVLPTVYGQMLVNRHDINQTNTLLKTGTANDVHLVDFSRRICENAGNGAVALDIGANFGVFSMACCQALAPLGGSVHAFEAQRVLAYMLCGSLALNSIENVTVHVACVGDSEIDIDVPRYDYHQALNFGSIEFGHQQNEPLDQQRMPSLDKVKQIRIDGFNISNVKLVKIDVEGMEWKVVQGARETIERDRPCVIIEFFKSDKLQLGQFFLDLDYKVWVWGVDFLCIPGEETHKYAISLPLFER